MELIELVFAALLFSSLVLESVHASASSQNEAAGGDRTRVRKCEPIGVRTCHGLGYNHTGLPNFVGHDTQPDADLQLRTFAPLIQYGCSAHLRFFLCAVYAPMCTEKVPDVIGPCRSVCERVRGRCEPVLRQFGFPWPANLNCSKFHAANDHDHMCMEGGGEDGGGFRTNETEDDDVIFPSPDYRTRAAPVTGGRGWCRSLKFLYSNRSRSCLLRCDQNLSFSAKDKRVMDIWMTVWSIMGVLCAVFVAVTFLVDDPAAPRSSGGSPDRHVVFMTLCHGMTSIVYAVRAVAGRDVIACVAVDPPRDVTLVLPAAGHAHTDCAVLFALLYYFTMAGIVWWVLLTVTWLFVAGLRWSATEAVQRLGTYFHVVAWTVPAVQVVVVLVRRDVEPSEYSGMCHVASGDPDAIAGHLLAPMVACLVVGMTFLGGGLAGHCQARSRTTRRACDRGAKEAAAAQADREAVTAMAAFAVACSVPLLGMTACVLVSYVNADRPRSTGSDTSVPLLDADRWEASLSSSSGPPRTEQKPVAVFLVEVLLSVLVAVFSAFRTVLSAGTKRAWSGFYRRRFGKGQTGQKPGRLPSTVPVFSPTNSPHRFSPAGKNVWNGGCRDGKLHQETLIISERNGSDCSTFHSPKIQSCPRNQRQHRNIQYIV